MHRELLPQQPLGYCILSTADTLIGALTVEEMLRYTADLKLPHTTDKAAKRQHVNSLLRLLKLEQCRSTRIGSALSRGISGGQARPYIKGQQLNLATQRLLRVPARCVQNVC